MKLLMEAKDEPGMQPIRFQAEAWMKVVMGVAESPARYVPDGGAATVLGRCTD